ncbi:G-protein coupled receptor 4-like [Acanthopagrus latus]|uniref:G-protein coupled receptor 4-like n=1 Tax=Acanthopagrus latus TaxID=8177 RepID=UPI00187CE916|nr:G-protein coupled receptor 4-like [Acanthopagrus latus]
MGGFNFTNISQNNSYKYSCNNSDCDVITHNLATTTLTCIIISIGLCLIPVAIYAVCSLVRKNHVAPIYVINLLISDLIQLCCLIIWVEEEEGSIIYEVGSFLYDVGLMASVGFMVCVALERYLVIAHPLWYSFRRAIKIPVLVCVVVWILPIVFNSLRFWIHSDTYLTIYATYLLLPLPLFIFFLGGTIRALSASRVPSDEKRRIVGILVLVLLIYTLLFMPFVIYHLSEHDDRTLFRRAYLFLQLSPLADLFLYVFMRKGTIDKLLASVCCCRMDSNDITSQCEG